MLSPTEFYELFWRKKSLNYIQVKGLWKAIQTRFELATFPKPRDRRSIQKQYFLSLFRH